MAVEDMFNYKNRAEIIMICRFIDSLVVKSNKEIIESETLASATAYEDYLMAYHDHSSIRSYNYSKEDLNLFSNGELRNLPIDDSKYLQTLVSPSEYQEFNRKVRNNYLGRFIDLNPYVAQFQGKPFNRSQYLSMKNYDSDLDEIIFLHEVDPINHPLTWNRLIVNREITGFVQANPTFIYLLFIENPAEPMWVRNSPNFTVFFYDRGIFDNIDTTNLLEAIRKAQLLFDNFYINDWDKRFPMYNMIISAVFIKNVINLFYVTKLEKYSLSVYTREEINNIFRSNGLPNLANISSDTLANTICLQLDLLISKKQSIDIFQTIYDILKDPDLTLSRLYLMKKYNVDLNNQTFFDLGNNKGVRGNVGLVLSSEVLAGNVSFTRDYDYRTFTDEDPTWAGWNEYQDRQTITDKMVNYEAELLKLNFYKLQTKYIVINKTIDLYRDYQRQVDLLFLFFQLSEKRRALNLSAPLFDVRLNFQDSQVNLLTLFLMRNFFNRILLMEDYAEADFLDTDITTAAYVSFLYNHGEVEQTIKDLYENGEVDLVPSMMKQKISTYFTIDELREMFPTYEWDAAGTVHEILRDHTRNFNQIVALEERIVHNYNYKEYMIGREIFRHIKGVYNFKNTFAGYTHFSEYVRGVEPALYLTLIGQGYFTTSRPSDEITIRLQSEAREVLHNYLWREFNITLDVISAQAESVRDLEILFNEFVSIRSEIFNTEFTFRITNYPYNMMIVRHLLTGASTKIFLSQSTKYSHDETLILQNLILNEDVNKILHYILNRTIINLEEVRYNIEHYINKIVSIFFITEEISIEENIEKINTLLKLKETIVSVRYEMIDSVLIGTLRNLVDEYVNLIHHMDITATAFLHDYTEHLEEIVDIQQKMNIEEKMTFVKKETISSQLIGILRNLVDEYISILERMDISSKVSLYEDNIISSEKMPLIKQNIKLENKLSFVKQENIKLRNMGENE